MPPRIIPAVPLQTSAESALNPAAENAMISTVKRFLSWLQKNEFENRRDFVCVPPVYIV